MAIGGRHPAAGGDDDRGAGAVITRLAFDTCPDGMTPEEWAERWRAAPFSPGEVGGPRRRSVATVLPTWSDDPPPHHVVVVDWFDEGADPTAAVPPGPEERSVVVAEAQVVRGGEWLAARWANGGPALAHLALARRAPGLDPVELSRRWRDHAGRVSGGGGVEEIVPDDVRGRAYVQHHPLPRTAGEWPYDAVTVVYLADEAALARRAAWLDDRRPAEGDPLFAWSRLLAVREELVEP